MSNVKPTKFWAFLTASLFLLLGMILGALIMLNKQKALFTHFREAQQSPKYAKFNLIDELLTEEYLDPEALSAAQSQMIENALKAYVAALNDPYTNYLTQEENTELVNILHDETGISGIGAVIQKRDNYIQVEEVIKNWPAYKAGLQPLDRIFFVDSGSTQDLTTNEAVEQIRGEKGSKVNLFIQREEKDETTKEFRITITRESIELPSVVATLIQQEEKKFWLFEITNISEYTTKLFVNELIELMNEDIEGMILDLRGNGGGYLEEASKFLGHFIPKGEIVVQSEYQAFNPITLTSAGRGELATIPTVIIIDQLTASAGEIIALALQERGVPVIWMPSFGKGSIQSFTEFPDGSSLKYTIGERYSPQGMSINQTGIIPDMQIPRDYELYQESGIDNQLEKAVELLVLAS